MFKTIFVVFAVCVAAAVAQTHPNIPDTFSAGTEVEIHGEGHEATQFGEGFFASDAQTTRTVEMYDIKDGFKVFHLFSLQRFDLKKDFSITSSDRNDCSVRDLNSNYIGPFDWVKDAHYVGEHRVRERTLDGWEAHVGGVRLFIAVSKDDPNTPVTMERESVHDYARYYFHFFNATTPSAQLFNVPSECQSTKYQFVRDPTRPNVAESFIASAEVELHDPERRATRFGDGFFASDSTGTGKISEMYDFHDGMRVFHLFSLQRFDLKKAFSISSEDRNDCRVHDLSSSFIPPFSWVAKAQYIGDHDIHGRVLDGWEYRTSGMRLLMGVDPSNVNVPIVMERESVSEYTRYHFHEFNSTIPAGKFFNVPSECQS